MSAVAGLTHQRYYVEEGCIIVRSLSLFQLRDTSLRSLQYLRLHDAICVNEENYVMLEGDCVWCLAYRRIKDVPATPKDLNTMWYAVIASLVEAMVGVQLEDYSLSLPWWWCDEQETI